MLGEAFKDEIQLSINAVCSDYYAEGNSNPIGYIALGSFENSRGVYSNYPTTLRMKFKARKHYQLSICSQDMQITFTYHLMFI